MIRHTGHKMGSKFSQICLAVIFFAIATACTGSDNHVTKISSGIPSESPTTFNPAGTPATPSETPPSENCIQTEEVTYNPKNLDFGLNQVGNSECQIITVTSCFNVEVQIDPSSSRSEISNPEDPTQTSSEAEFEVGNKTGIGKAEICYKRKGVGSHTGKAIIKLDASHTIIVPLVGQALPKILTLTKPTDPAIVWASTYGPAKAGSESVPYEEYFEVPVEGKIDTQTYAGLLSGQKNEVIISVENGGITKKIPYSADGSFTGIVEVPNVGRVYPITFAIKTNKGIINTSIQAIKLEKPAVSLEIRNGEDQLVNLTSALPSEAKTTNSNFLTAGIVVSNIDVSAPNEAHPILAELTLTKTSRSSNPNYPETKLVYMGGDQWMSADGNRAAAIVGYHKGIEFDEKSLNKCKQVSFEKNTLCIPLPPTGQLGSGVNFIEAIVCNDVTGTQDQNCIKVKATLIVNNNLPRIVVETPIDNCVYPENGQNSQTQCAIADDGNVILKGFIENYDPGVTIDEDGKKTYGCSVSFWLNSHDTPDNALKYSNKKLCPQPQSIGGETIHKTHNSGNKGNIKRGNFSINLSRDFANKLTRYTNVVQILAKNTEGHIAYHTVSFQLGKIKQGTKVSKNSKRNIFSAAMGAPKSGGSTTNMAPVMLNISEKTINNAKVKEIIKKMLNDNLKFSTLAMGGGLRENKDGKIQIGTGTDKPETEENIARMLRGTMPEQVRALMDYQQIHGSTTKYFPQDQAVDACNQPITTAIITPDVYQYLFPEWDPAWLGDADIGLREWPGVCYDKNGKTNPNCNTTEEGKWDIDIDLKKDGFVDVKLTLNGLTDKNGKKKPAFWGHYTAYNLVDEGTTGAYSKLPYEIPVLAPVTGPILGPIMKGQGLADPAIPLLMNVGRMTINLKDVLRIYKVQKNDDGSLKTCFNPNTDQDEPCECTNSNCTNMVYLDRAKIQNSKSTFTFEPFNRCEEYFREKWPDKNLPYGCSSDESETFPFLIDTTSTQGYLLWDIAGKQGSNIALLALIKDVFDHTFKNVVSCIPNHLMLSEPIELGGDRTVDRLMINSTIDPLAFPYAKWVAESDKIDDLTIAIERKDGEIEFGLADSVTNPIASIKPYLKDADILINDGNLQVKLPFSMGAYNIKESLFTEPQHLYRDSQTDFDSIYPLNEIIDKPYASISLGIEELLHSATSVLLKKGIQPLLDLFDVDEFTYPRHYNPKDDWTIGLDEVILGRLEICGDIGGNLLATNLPTDNLFPSITTLFEQSGTHWDIRLDPNSPVTLNMKPLDEADIDTEIKNDAGVVTETKTPDAHALLEIGLTNATISVHDFIKDADSGLFTIGQDEVIKLGLDAIIKLRLKYFKSERHMTLEILPLGSQSIYVTAINKNVVYDDNMILSGVKKILLENAFGYLSQGQFDIYFPKEISKLDTVGVGKVTKQEVIDAIDAGGLAIVDNTALGPNGSCEGKDLPAYANKQTGRLSSSIIDTIRNTMNPHKIPTVADLTGNKPIINIKDILATNGLQNAGAVSLVDLLETEDDPCKTPDMISEIAGNDIKESLCDLGIKEITMGNEDPNIQLDTNNGFIHVSTQIFIEIYDWVQKANNE